MRLAAGSLQRRLTGSIIAVVGLALAVLSATQTVESERRAWERFDERLAEEARKAAALARLQPDGTWTVPEGALAPLDQSRGRTEYQLWTSSGAPLARFPADAPALTPPAAGAPPSVEPVTLSDGRRVRLHRAWERPGSILPGGPRVAVAVARELDVIDARLGRQRALLWGSTLAVVALAAAVSSLVVRGSLRDVARLSAGIAALDASSLARRLDLRGLPSELLPPFAKLNELLDRLEATVKRERQLGADVSHELRTPIAGLRAILEISASRERPGPEYRRDLGEALEVVRQIEAIVENLTMLARLGSGQATVERCDGVRLRELVEACLAPRAEAARRRRLRIDVRVPPELELSSDPVKLRLVAANLLANAVEYTEEGGWIAVEADPARGVVLAVRDSGPPVPEDALGRLFDPFFRLDRARSGGGEHCGIGLALVRALCDALGYGVEARNEPGGAVAFIVTVGAARAAASPAGAAAGA